MTLVGVAVVASVAVSACGGDDDGGDGAGDAGDESGRSAPAASGGDPVVADPATGSTSAPTADSASPESGVASAEGSIFPPDIEATIDVQQTVDIPSGGRAAVGLVCRPDGGDIAYAAVEGVADGMYMVDGGADVPGDISVMTGLLGEGAGFGAYQSAFDLADYSFVFVDLDVTVDISGCG